MSAYARLRPALGFDPAPGDVDSTRNLAQQHALVAQEARQVLVLIERLNLSALPGSVGLTADVQTASANVDGIQRQAQDLHQRYLAAASRTAAGVEDHASVWDGTEPVRKVLEAVLAPLDIVAADHWVSALKEVAGVPAEWVAGVDEKLSEVRNLSRAGKSPPSTR